MHDADNSDMRPAVVIRACAIAVHVHIESKHALQPLPSALNRFAEHWQTSRSLISLESLFERAYSSLYLSPEILIYSVILIERLMRAVGADSGALRLSTARRLVATALAIAAKFCSDEVEPTILTDLEDAFTLQYGTTLMECELDFLTLIRYRLNVEPTLFSTYHVALLSTMERHDGIQAKSSAVQKPAPRTKSVHFKRPPEVFQTHSQLPTRSASSRRGRTQKHQLQASPTWFATATTQIIPA